MLDRRAAATAGKEGFRWGKWLWGISRGGAAARPRSLDEADRDRPTDCTGWPVRQLARRWFPQLGSLAVHNQVQCLSTHADFPC
jgi:hypothetical protein